MVFIIVNGHCKKHIQFTKSITINYCKSARKFSQQSLRYFLYFIYCNFLMYCKNFNQIKRFTIHKYATSKISCRTFLKIPNLFPKTNCNSLSNLILNSKWLSLYSCKHTAHFIWDIYFRNIYFKVKFPRHSLIYYPGRPCLFSCHL